ncbi:hypothetical protein GEMRC1_008010 [Eukaryota sp. GEM-RC1]
MHQKTQRHQVITPAWILSPLSRYMDSFFSSPVDVMLPPCCLYLTQYEAESPAWILSPLSRYMDSFFSSPVDVMLPPCCLYLTQYEAESPAWILSPLSRYMDSFFSSPVDVMLPPCCLYLTQYEAESPAWILSPLSRYMDSFFSSPVDVMLPPCCLYLTQYEAESPAWILSPLSRYMDSFFSSPVDVMLPPCCLYLTQYEAESPAWILSPLSRYMDSFFSSPVDVMLPPCCLYLTQYEAESPAWILSPLSPYMDSFFSSPVDVMLPPCCLYLTQYEAESPAWILSPLSRYMDSFFYVVKTLPSLLLYVLYFYSCVIPSHPPFPKDLTADGDIESNPGPVTQEAINSVYPHQWVDDEAIVEYCKVIFQEAELDFESMFIHPTTLLQYIVSPDAPLDQWLLTKIEKNQIINSKYLFVPLSDTMTRNANYSREGVTGSHWGLAIIDCCEKEWIFIDPMLTTVDMSKSMVKSAVDILFEVLVPWGYDFRYVHVTKSQSANDFGVYVIAYIQKYVELFKRLMYVPSLMYMESDLVQVNIELQADIFREEILEVLSQQRTLYLQQRQTTVAPIVPSLPIQPPAGSRLASTKTSTGFSTKKSKPKISDIPSPRGSPLIQRNKFRTTSSLVSTGDTPIRKTHRRMSTLESSEVPPSELAPSPSEVPPSELPPKSQASIMSYPSPIQEEIQKMEVNLHTEPIEEEIQIQDFLKSPLLWNNLPTFCLIHVQRDFAKKKELLAEMFNLFKKMMITLKLLKVKLKIN